MPTPPLPDVVREILARPNPCVMATLRKDGTPVTVATWYLLDGDRILVNLDETRKRLEHLRRDPRVSLTVFPQDNWYTHVSVQGRVVELVDDTDRADVDRVSRHYTGDPYPAEGKRVSAYIEIDRWHGWNLPDGTEG